MEPMRICYVLLSPTFGMHQYTADLANRMAEAGHDVHVVTTAHVPRDRYAPLVKLHTPVSISSTGFSFETGRLLALVRALRTVQGLAPDIVHFTGPHLWNVFLMRSLVTNGIPVAHTLHDLHPHAGAFYGRLLYLWNEWVQRNADHLLVHGKCYRDELLARGAAPSRVTHTPLTMLFVSHEREQALAKSLPTIQYEPWVLFFARLEVYKGLPILVEAARRLMKNGGQPAKVIIAGKGRLDKLCQNPLTSNVEVRNRLICDEEAVDLFRRCGLLVLPYVEASQSALIASAYFFRKPVIVTDVGALTEYVVEGETGWVIPPGDPQALADTLQAALADTARLAHMGQAAREWYDSRRQIEEANLQQMYVDVVNRSCDADPEVSTSTLPTSLYGEAEG